MPPGSFAFLRVTKRYFRYLRSFLYSYLPIIGRFNSLSTPTNRAIWQNPLPSNNTQPPPIVKMRGGFLFSTSLPLILRLLFTTSHPPAPSLSEKGCLSTKV